MAEEDDSEKTEEPSDRKLAKGKEKGQVASSQEVKSWAILLGGTAGLIILAPFMTSNIRETILPFLESPHAIPTDAGHLRMMLANLSQDIGLILAPIMGLLVVIALVSNVGQSGLIFATEKVMPDIEKISIIKGAKRLASSRAVVEFLKGISKLLVVGAVSFFMVLPLLGDLTMLPSMDINISVDRIRDIAVILGIGTVSVMTVIAALDFAYQKHMFLKQMRMSKHEVKEEQKQTDGDPQIKARIRKVRMERAQQRMMAAVPDADVVITNPTHYAVALSYNLEDSPAPCVLVKGIRKRALRIKELAIENDIPTIEDRPLARALYDSVPEQQEIPEELYPAVAAILAEVYRQRDGK